MRQLWKFVAPARLSWRNEQTNNKQRKKESDGNQNNNNIAAEQETGKEKNKNLDK